MALTSRDSLMVALATNASRLIFDKASLANTAAGQFFSLWQATGQPGAGATPTTAAICDKNLVGSFQWPNQTAPVTSYLGRADLNAANALTTVEVHDRLAHQGGLVMNVATLQTTNLALDLSTLGLVAARRGMADFSNVQWWLEVYLPGGATGVNCTVNVTYNDGTTGALTAFALGATPRAGRMYPLNGLIPAAAAGKYIRGVTSVQLSATTGTAGNFGVTATRKRGVIDARVANVTQNMDWAALGLPEIPNDSCLFPVVLCSTTTTGTVRGGLDLAHV